MNQYYNEIKILDKNKNIMKFTGTFYTTVNDYMTDRIYLRSTIKNNLNNALNDINNIIKNLSAKYNDQLFQFNDEIYVWRGENNRIIGEMGSFYNAKNGDEIISHTPISTSLTNAFVKGVTLKIKINKNSLFAILMKYSNVPSENEILLPFGAKFRVTNSSYTRVNGNETFLIEADYINNINLDTENFINFYKNLIQQDNSTALTGLMFSTINATSITNISSGSVPINMSLITNTLRNYILKDLDELNIDKPYEDFIKTTKGLTSISKLPPFNTNKAYIGENLTGNFNEFCKIENLDKYVGTQNNFNILSFNVHNFVKICKPFGRDISHIINFIGHLINITNIDVISLQEIVPLYDTYPDNQIDLEKGSFRQLIDMMTNFGFPHYSLVNTNHDYTEFINNYFILGNAIFSKLKPKNVHRYGLVGNRSAIVYNLEHNYYDLNIINVHLEWNAHNMSPTYNKPYIEIQVNQLEEILQKHKNFILTGDFNNSVYDNNLFNNIKKISRIISPKNVPNSYTGFNNQNLIDYIIISNNLAKVYDYNSTSMYNDKIITDVSDHYPVFASLIPKVNTNILNTINLSDDLYTQLSRIILNYYQNIISSTINILFTNKLDLSRNDVDIFIVPDRYNHLSYPFYYYLPLIGNNEYLNELKKMLDEFKNMGHRVNLIFDNNVYIYDNVKLRFYNV